MCLLVIQGLLPGVTVYLIKQFVDRLVTVKSLGISPENLQLLIIPTAFIAVTFLLTELLQGAQSWIRTVQSELVQDYINHLIHQKSTAVDIAFYESPEDSDRLHRAQTDASGRSLALLENSGSLLQNSLTLLAMATILIPYGAWLPLILLFSTLPALLVMLKTNQQYHRWWHRTTEDRRRIDYYNLVLTHKTASAEIRLFDLGKYFQSAYQKLRQRLLQEKLQLLKQQNLAQFGAGTTGLIISGGMAAWTISQFLQGQFSFGDLALFYQAFTQGQNLMRTLLRNVGQIYTNSLFISDLFAFLHLESQLPEPAKPHPVPLNVTKEICFRQVTFRYPGSDRPVLENFNLTIPAGKIVAIVGDNGAGKSTLIKLLCRFYDPEAGQIELDGVDLRQFSVKQLRQLLTVMFQFPVPYYHATAAESIALGDIESHPSQEEIEVAAKGAAAHEVILRLPKGYETLLGKWFSGGAELSGGEWQRIALARAFLRQAGVMILDEPTSAMDAWAEANWLDRFRVLVEDRTALVITHRFTLAMRADIIHVMRSGQIVESGNHQELLDRGGLYAQSWAAQIEGEKGRARDKRDKRDKREF
jgi:ATP-binding cassette subfamily B protein